MITTSSDSCLTGEQEHCMYLHVLPHPPHPSSQEFTLLVKSSHHIEILAKSISMRYTLLMQRYLHGSYRISKVEWRVFDLASLQRLELQENGQLDSQNDLHGDEKSKPLINRSAVRKIIREAVNYTENHRSEVYKR